MSAIDPRYRFGAARDRLVAQVREYLAVLSEDERSAFVDELLDGYCKLCFTDKLPCYCAPGYDE